MQRIYIILELVLTWAVAYFLCSMQDTSKHRVPQKTDLLTRTPSSTSSNSQRRANPPTSARTTASPSERRMSPAKQPITSHCRYCGTPITEGKTICRRCYTERTVQKNNPAPTTRTTATRTKQNPDQQQLSSNTTSSKILYCPECFSVAENGTVKCPHCGCTLQEI